MSLKGLILRGWQSLILLKAPEGEFVPFLLQFLEAACIPWLLVSSLYHSICFHWYTYLDLCFPFIRTIVIILVHLDNTGQSSQDQVLRSIIQILINKHQDPDFIIFTKSLLPYNLSTNCGDDDVDIFKAFTLPTTPYRAGLLYSSILLSNLPFSHSY